jgi:hypothetical protein
MSATVTCRRECRSHRIFARGFADGAAGIACETRRKASERFPMLGDLDLTVYLNGAEDGARGDRYRLEMPAADEQRRAHDGTPGRRRAAVTSLSPLRR